MPSSDNFRNLTDEQWLWLFVNECIDNDEQLERMCQSCKDEATSKDKCIRCGKVLSTNNKPATFVNPNFDRKRFERLSNEEDSGVDTDLLKQIEDGGHIGEQEDSD